MAAYTKSRERLLRQNIKWMNKRQLFFIGRYNSVKDPTCKGGKNNLNNRLIFFRK